MGDKDQIRKIGNRGPETRNKEVRHGIEDEDGRQGTKKEQRGETGNRGWETRNRHLRQES
jgi:hypothetical protein